jgi:hypothetical protein
LRIKVYFEGRLLFEMLVLEDRTAQVADTMWQPMANRVRDVIYGVLDSDDPPQLPFTHESGTFEFEVSEDA